MSQGTKILLVEDSEDDYLLIKRELDANISPLKLKWVKTKLEFEENLAEESWDIILSDYNLENYYGLEIFQILERTQKDIPFILVSGTIKNEIAVNAMKAGVSDYIIKENLSRLAPAIKREIEESQNRKKKKEAEQELRKSKLELEQIFNSIEPMCLISRDFRFFKINKAFCELFEKTAEEIMLLHCYELMKTPNCDTGNCPMVQIISGYPKVEYEFEFIPTKGKSKNCLVTALPYIDWEGNLIGLVETLTDVTQIRSLEKQLLQSQKMEALGRFAGGIAHDFNNILTIILGLSQLIYNSMDETNEYRSDIEEIIHTSERASALTDQILTFSRKHPMKTKTFDIIPLIKNLKQILQRMIGEDVELKTIFTVDKAKIKSDPIQMEQVFMNLATNARDAMPNGGVLTIKTSIIDTQLEEFYSPSTLPPAKYLYIQYRDTGVGIEPEKFSHLFEPFFTTKEKGKGTGLGLSVVYGIIKQIGGEIQVSSTKFMGTTFHIYIPLSNQPLEIELPDQNLASALNGNETILVVEDELAVRHITQSILRNFGYSVILAKNGIEAIQRFQRGADQLQLIITDLIMPKMGGDDLYSYLRSQKISVKFLFMSGYSLDSSALEKFKFNPDYFIQKPFSPLELLTKIRSILDSNTYNMPPLDEKPSTENHFIE